MRYVGDAGLLFLGEDLDLQFARHAFEFGNHHVELKKLPPLVVHLKLFQSNQVLTCFHRLKLPDTQTPIQNTIAQLTEAARIIGNRLLRFFGPGNHSFTRIVNHTGQDLRRGKNPG